MSSLLNKLRRARVRHGPADTADGRPDGGNAEVADNGAVPFGPLQLLTDTDDQCDEAPCSSSPPANGQIGRDNHCDLGVPRVDGVMRPRSAHVSRGLEQTLRDHTAQLFFVEFMHSLQLAHLIQFWLHAESFAASTASSSAAHIGGSGDSRSAPNGDDSRSSAFVKMLEQDAVSIFTKYIAKDAQCSIETTQEVRDAVVNKICVENGKLDYECFRPAQLFVFHVLRNRYYPEYVKSVYYSKYLLEVLSAGVLSLDDIMRIDGAQAAFTEFMDVCKQGDLLEFYVAAHSWRSHMQREGATRDGAQAQDDAMLLYDKYFSLQAPHRVHVGDAERIDLENNICREGGPLADCFDRPLLTARHTMEQVHIVHFAHSHQWRRFVDDLRHTVDRAVALPNAYRRGQAPSDGASSSGELSTASNNNDRGRRRHSTLNTAASTAPVDTLSLCSAASGGGTAAGADEPLWHRHKSGSLLLSHVDHLGRYVRDYEHRPDGEHGDTRARRVVDRVHSIINPAAKDEDAIAAEVASLIVTDIQTQCAATAAMLLQ